MRSTRLWLALLAGVVVVGCSYQEVTVQTVPPGAEVYLDDERVGVSPVRVDIPSDSFANALGKVHTVKATLAGHDPASIVLTSDSDFFSNTSPYPDPVVLYLLPRPGEVAAPPAPPPAARATPPPPPPRARPRLELPAPGAPAFSSEGGRGGGSRRAVLVVVDRHANREWDPKQADQAVTRLTAALEAGLGVAGDRLVVLRGEAATKNGLARALRTVGEAARGKDDLLLVYFYGHGCVQDGELQLFTADTELEGQRYTNTIGHADLGGLYGRCRAAARERGADVQVVSVVDACRVRSLAPPGPARYVPLEDVAEVFSAKPGQFAGEGAFVEPFCAALTDLARRDRTLLGDVVDAARAAVKRGGGEQEPELAHGRRDLVLRDVAGLRFDVEVWDQVGAGRRVDGAVVTIGDQRFTTPGAVEGLRPGVYRLRVEQPGYLPRDVRVEVGPGQSGQLLRVPVLPALVLVQGQVRPGARVRLGGARPEGTVEGYHALDVKADADGWFVLRAPALPAGAELLVDGGPALPVPAAPAGHEAVGEARVPRHDLGRAP